MTTAAAAQNPRVSRNVVLAGAGLAAIAVIGVILVFAFVADQRDRDMRAWQTRMGIVADRRFAAVNGWIEAQYGEMRELAENVSLQIYLTELELFSGDASQVTDEPYFTISRPLAGRCMRLSSRVAALPPKIARVSATLGPSRS